MMRFQSKTIIRALGVLLAVWGLSSCSDGDAPAIAQDMPPEAATDDSSVSVTEAGSVALAFGTERFGIAPSRSNTYDNYNESSLTYPVGDYVTSSKIEYHMNWGWNGTHNAWYVDTKVDRYDFKYSRKNIYVYK